MSPRSKQLFVNGIDATTGEYLLPPLSPEDLATLAQAQPLDPDHNRELKWRLFRRTEAHFGPLGGLDLRNLAETGWGVVFANDEDPAIREALEPLLAHRRRQAAARHEHYYQEYAGSRGHRPGEKASDFTERMGVGRGSGLVDPDEAPYYLLLVGSPERIPFSFQYQVDVRFAVGRLHFETTEEYARYASSVVEAETHSAPRPLRAVFFGVRHDEATAASADVLVRPLAEALARKQRDWEVSTVLAREATKARLSRLLGGDETPRLLFTASHGLDFIGHPLQRSRQGALLCQDCLGSKQRRGPIPPEFYFSGADVTGAAKPAGLIAFFFACHGAGTPQYDNFAQEKIPVAPHPFVARLPQTLLAHPNGGALAVIGHVDRAFSYSFEWKEHRGQLATFKSALRRLMMGDPVGAAMDDFNFRYMTLAVSLYELQEDVEHREEVDAGKHGSLWTAVNDARNMVILGDPAVRIAG